MNALFSWLIQNRLVYTVSWEDWELDKLALKLDSNDRVVMITGGGCNVLNFFLSGVRSLHAVDLNPCQNALLELKLAGAGALDFPDFFALFGEGLHPDFPQIYQKVLRARLSPPAQKFWDRRQDAFRPGMWRRRFHHRSTAGLAYKILLEWRRLWPQMGRKLDALFFCDTIAEQVAAYRVLDLRGRFDSPLFRWIFRRQMLMDLMAIPREQFRQIENNYAGGMPAFAMDCMERVFTRTLLKENYFWYVAWFGRFTPTCCPAYLREENFSRLAGAAGSIHIHTTKLSDFLGRSKEKFDKFVLLDHMDWLAGPDRSELAREWDGIVRTASSHARIIFRTAAPDAYYLQNLPIAACGRTTMFQDCVHSDRLLSAELHQKDRVAIYGNFYICTLNGAA
jgi:S-adenosylmethionine-diacylglycerol 3-amino-3-carboxypropyl transferase